MKRKLLAKAAVSSLLVATTMVGCTGAAFRPSASIAPQKGDSAKLAVSAEKALANHDSVKAVEAAEAAVALAPQNAAHREILGRAYIQAGRFASANSALSDAITLGSTDARTIVGLALVQVAQGQPEQARNLLASHADIVPASDYGLAMAMAGDTQEGVRILSGAIHDPSANARTRQNLAYAYALAGRWKDARMIVGMDLDPLAANKRISDWAQIAEPSLAPMRVAALMGVAINGNDAGLPVSLALATPQPAVAPVALAQNDVKPAPVPPMLAQNTVLETAAAEPIAAPPMVAPAVRPSPMRVAHMQHASFLKPVTKDASGWVVQLGAYDTAAVAQEKWMDMARHNSMLAAFPVLTSQTTVRGRGFHRLAINGFASRADALATCHSIKAHNGRCFVRQATPDATLQRWAVATKGRQFASR